jgi:hypothetical protein
MWQKVTKLGTAPAESKVSIRDEVGYRPREYNTMPSERPCASAPDGKLGCPCDAFGILPLQVGSGADRVSDETNAPTAVGVRRSTGIFRRKHRSKVFARHYIHIGGQGDIVAKPASCQGNTLDAVLVRHQPHFNHGLAFSSTTLRHRRQST